ncbi:hypothetical protein, partial [Listeria grandensis]|uniref:hypothetical protein n=1 Tax=Listeria grandensis TaxID=1494963 RepID=UPI001C9C7E9E
MAVEAGSEGAGHDAVHGLYAHYVLMHIVALTQQGTLRKSHNKAETARSAPKKNWSGRSKKPILLFMEGVKISRSWP